MSTPVSSAATAPVLISVGTRPEIIKMAPVHAELRRRGLPVAWVHTGQHREMADALYDFFGIEPEHEITLDRKNASLAHLNGLLLEHLQDIPESGVSVKIAGVPIEVVQAEDRQAYLAASPSWITAAKIVRGRLALTRIILKPLPILAFPLACATSACKRSRPDRGISARPCSPALPSPALHPSP